MTKSPRMLISLAAVVAFVAVGRTPAFTAQTHSISGKIVVEGREKYGGVIVWVDTLHAAETDSLGRYGMAGFENGEYVVKAWSRHCLARIVDTVQVSGYDVTGVNDTLFAGDFGEDGRINLLDVSEILRHYQAMPGSDSWDEAFDLNLNDVIDSLDVAALMRHWKEIDDLQPPTRIVVTEPNGAAIWTIGQRNVPISWETGNLQGAVSIVLYRSGSPVDTIADPAPNNGSYNGYVVPVDMTPGANYRVAVRFNGSNYDYSDYFEIQTTILVTEPSSSTVWRPGQQDVPIHWITGDIDGPVSISIFKGSSMVETITSSTPNDGSYTTYDVPESLVPEKDYYILVLHIDSGVRDYSDYFEIRQFVVVTEPSSATIWNRGQANVPITWITGNFGGSVDINLYKGTSLVHQWQHVSNDGAYQVGVPTNVPLGTDYGIEIYLDADHGDFGDYFAIQDSTIVVMVPNSNTVWLSGQHHVSIHWESSLSNDPVSIGLYKGDNPIETIVPSTPNGSEYSDYSVPTGLAPGTDYRVRVDRDAQHYFSDYFGIEKPSGWIWQYPSHQPYHLYAVSFTDANTGTAVGEYGTILRTTDGGATWVGQWASTRRHLYGVAFTDANTGLAVGQGGVILKTTDGGTTWISKTSRTNYDLAAVSFADADTAEAVGGTAGHMTYCRTTDGGDTWTYYEQNSYAIPLGVSFFNARIGAVVEIQQILLWTTNGGASWKQQTCAGGDIEDRLRGVSVLDANTAVAVGSAYYDGFYPHMLRGVIKTTRNGGITCGTQFVSAPLRAVSFADINIGTAVGDYGAIYRSTDGGVTWVQQTSGTGVTLNGVSFTDANTGTAVGNYGTILRTTDGGAAWVAQTEGTTYTLRGISFAGPNTGTVVGGDGGRGIILRTTDAGATWLAQYVADMRINGVSFADADTGTAVGGYEYSTDLGVFGSGWIFRTTDGGATWEKQATLRGPLYDVLLMDPSTGTAVGGDYEEGWWADRRSLIIHTQDGGTVWAPQTTGANCHLYGVCFTDVNTGVAVGQWGTIFRTTDGGATWIHLASGTNRNLNDVHFTDASTGAAVGDGGTILRTVDGGTVWTVQSGGTSSNLNGVWFVDANTGMVVGDSGTILRTTDGGATWVKQYAGTARNLRGVYFSDAYTGTVVGDGGTILGTTTGGE